MGFIPAGQNAQGQMAAYTGGMGRDAQQQAYDNFIESPGQAWLREQGDRAVTRNAAATGGLQGGRVLQELQRQGQGLAAQDFQNHYARLAGLSNQGLQAAGQVGSLRGQQGMMNANMRQAQAGLKGNLATALAGIRAQQGGFQGQMGQGIANLRQNAGNQLGQLGLAAGTGMGNMMYGTGQNIAGGRMAVGNAIANRIGSTTDNMANLQNQQGAGMSDIIGQGQNTVGNLLTGAGGMNAQALTQLAQLLSGVNMQSGGMYGGFGMPGVSQTPGALGGLGNLASGVGNFMTGWNNLGG